MKDDKIVLIFVGSKRFFQLSSASLGRWASVCLQEEPPSLCAEEEGDQEFPYLFWVALVHPFHLKGGVEYARLPSVGTRSDTSDELLSGKSEWRPVPHLIGVGWWSRDAL